MASTHALQFVGYLAKKSIDFQLNIKSFNDVNQTFEYSDIALLGSRHICGIITKTGQERKKQTHRPNEIADFGLFPVNPVFPYRKLLLSTVAVDKSVSQSFAELGSFQEFLMNLKPVKWKQKVFSETSDVLFIDLSVYRIFSEICICLWQLKYITQ